MAEVVPTPAPKADSPVDTILKKLDAQDAQLTEQKNKFTEIEKKLNEPVRVPWATSGPIGQDSQPYSIMKVAAFCTGAVGRDAIKPEFDLHERLKSYLKKDGWAPGVYGNATFLVPYASQYLTESPENRDEGIKLQYECRQKMMGWHGQYDPQEADWIASKTGMSARYKAALGTISETAGGVLVGFPTLGELIDLQRNMEVFANAGSTEVGLPPNGRLQFPKLTGGATAYWVGESVQMTSSVPTTGFLDLIAKKLGVLVQMNNELIRFASPTAEGMVRLDMARVAALKADLAMLEGTGGTQIKGLITYPNASSWTVNNDKLILLMASTTGTTGDTMTGKDVHRMVEALPDAVPEPTAWIMRKQMWQAIKNFRADSITTGDAAGQFLFSQMRTLEEKMTEYLVGYKVVRSSQVSTTRSKGGSATNTYVVTGYFPDWITARFGVMEFLATQLGDTAFQNDQTWLRAIQLLDAGPRHAASFVLMDTLANNGGV
jgi:HK97 family phage major capsid protein